MLGGRRALDCVRTELCFQAITLQPFTPILLHLMKARLKMYGGLVQPLEGEQSQNAWRCARVSDHGSYSPKQRPSFGNDVLAQQMHVIFALAVLWACKHLQISMATATNQSAKWCGDSDFWFRSEYQANNDSVRIVGIERFLIKKQIYNFSSMLQ